MPGDEGDAARLFEDSSFDVVESSAVIHDNKKQGEMDSMSKMKTKEKLESAMVDQCIFDIQENDSLLEERDQRTSPEKHSESLYGPTQLVSLLNKTATKAMDDLPTVNASGDLFGDDDEEDVFRDIGEDQFKKPQDLDESKHLAYDAMAIAKQPLKSNMSPATKCSPRVSSLNGCDADADISPVAQDTSDCHEESTLCVRRRKRNLISSDESSAGLNESCDSPLLMIQGRYSVIS